MDFQQSKTFINLQNAFIGETVSSTKYSIYSIKARQEGYIEISNWYDSLSGFEREHATVWLKLLNNGAVPTTLDNLNETTQTEGNTGNSIYRDYASTAREEGFDNIASLFEGVANIELAHETEAHTFASDIQSDQVFCKPEAQLWICLNCGNILGGDCAPEICPICGFPQGYYQIYNPVS